MCGAPQLKLYPRHGLVAISNGSHSAGGLQLAWPPHHHRGSAAFQAAAATVEGICQWRTKVLSTGSPQHCLPPYHGDPPAVLSICHPQSSSCGLMALARDAMHEARLLPAMSERHRNHGQSLAVAAGNPRGPPAASEGGKARLWQSAVNGNVAAKVQL